MSHQDEKEPVLVCYNIISVLFTIGIGISVQVSMCMFKMLSKLTCEQCDYKATRKFNLLRHMKSLHEGVKFTRH